MMVFFLVYVSSATNMLSPSDLDDIREVAVRTNTALDITGALLYKDGNFLQILEGEESAVRTLYADITGDPRHKGLIVIWTGRQATRQFPRWSMAFRDVTGPGAMPAPGYSEFLNTPLTAAEFGPDPMRCERLLLSFKESML